MQHRAVLPYPVPSLVDAEGESSKYRREFAMAYLNSERTYAGKYWGWHQTGARSLTAFPDGEEAPTYEVVFDGGNYSGSYSLYYNGKHVAAGFYTISGCEEFAYRHWRQRNPEHLVN
jgi:hypothetical protein